LVQARELVWESQPPVLARELAEKLAWALVWESLPPEPELARVPVWESPLPEPELAPESVREWV
jgi:hypothetical protein